MSTLTIRLPDVTALSLQDLAHTRGPGMGTVQATLIHQSPTPMVDFLFLDFDGVFTLTYGRAAKVDSYVKTLAVAFLDSALTELGIKIVVSSSWRIGEDRLRLSTYLDLAGFTARLHDDFKTKSTDGFRGNDVREWLSRHPEVSEWVIIDDETDFHEDQLDRLVHVDMFEGFGARDYGRLKSVFETVKDPDLLRPFKNCGIGRDLPAYIDQYLLDNGEA